MVSNIVEAGYPMGGNLCFCYYLKFLDISLIFYNWWGWINMTTFPYDVPDHIRLRGLSLAIHTLKQLTTNQGSNIIDIANKYDSDPNFVMSVIDFLKDIRWLSQDENGKYIVTEQGVKEISYVTDNN